VPENRTGPDLREGNPAVCRALAASCRGDSIGKAPVLPDIAKTSAQRTNRLARTAEQNLSFHRLQKSKHSSGRYRSSWLCNHALRPDEFFFLLSAHLFFIKTDNRLRPAAVKWCFRIDDPLFLGDPLLAGMLWPVLPPSSAAIARSRRFLSAFSSDTIPCVSKIGSSVSI